MPDRNKTAETEAGILRRQRAVLVRFGGHALRARDLDALLHEATELVSDALGVRLVKVLELLPDGERMLVRAGVNWQPGVVGHATFGADGDSPSGYALKTGEPVISTDLSSERRFEIPDVLHQHGVQSMVNVVIRGEGPAWGVLEVDSPSGREFGDEEIEFLQTYANLLAAAIQRLQTHRQLEQALEKGNLLLRELRHRIQNLLANVHGMAKRTADRSTDLESFMSAFEGRLIALSRTQNLLTREIGRPVNLRDILAMELEAHGAAIGERVSLGGPDVLLPPESAQALAMAFHELATNASKHGALARDDGRLEVSWDRDAPPKEPAIRITWRETGVDIDGEQKRPGLGTEILERALPHMLGGTCDRTFHGDGLECAIRFPEPAR